MKKPLPKPAISPDQMAALERSRLQACYREVFGIEGRRSVAQQRVWADLCVAGFAHQCTHVLHSGLVSSIDGAHNDGRRWLFLYIQANSALPGEAQPKPQ